MGRWGLAGSCRHCPGAAQKVGREKGYLLKPALIPRGRKDKGKNGEIREWKIQRRWEAGKSWNKAALLRQVTK